MHFSSHGIEINRDWLADELKTKHYFSIKCVQNCILRILQKHLIYIHHIKKYRSILLLQLILNKVQYHPICQLGDTVRS